MVQALYLPHNYELSTALLEWNTHYVTVNHCLHAPLLFGKGVEHEAATCSHQAPPPMCRSARFASCKSKERKIHSINPAEFRLSDWIFSHQNIKVRLLIPAEPAERIKRCWNYKRGGVSIAGGLWWRDYRPQRRKRGFSERNRWLKAIIVFASAKYQKRLLVSLSVIRLIPRDGFFSRCQTRGGRTVNHLALWFQ